MAYTVYDIECLRNFFCYADISIDGNIINLFEISRFKNDLKALLEYYKTLKGQVGFNSLSYDVQVMQWIINNSKQLVDLEGEQIAKLIYERSNNVIHIANSNQWPDYKEKDFSVKQLDLFKIWHYDNKARMTGLKWLQFSMDWRKFGRNANTSLDYYR